MSRKSWAILYRKLLYKMGQDFLNIQYHNMLASFVRHICCRFVRPPCKYMNMCGCNNNYTDFSMFSPCCYIYNTDKHITYYYRRVQNFSLRYGWLRGVKTFGNEPFRVVSSLAASEMQDSCLQNAALSNIYICIVYILYVQEVVTHFI